MKLKHFEYIEAYTFDLTFEDGRTWRTDLQDLIGHQVPIENLKTARIDPNWGCMEFSDGRVDIEPKTLYRFASKSHCRQAA